MTPYKVNQILPNGFGPAGEEKKLICIKALGCNGCKFQTAISCHGHADRCGTLILVDHEKKTSYLGGAGRPA